MLYPGTRVDLDTYSNLLFNTFELTFIDGEYTKDDVYIFIRNNFDVLKGSLFTPEMNELYVDAELDKKIRKVMNARHKK